MALTLRQLQYFVALTEQRNFRRAAEVCHVSQPALSVQIRELEQSLGGPLVERHARDVTLTPFGRQALITARRVLDDVRGLEQAARERGGLGGTLSLGVIPTIAPYLLPDALAALRSTDISLDVRITEAKTDRLLAMLEDGTLDACILALPSETRGVVERPLFEDRFLLAGSAARLTAMTDAPMPETLGSAQLLLLEDGHCLTEQALAVCGRGRAQPGINMGASSLATLSRLVGAGFGLTLLPEIALETERAAAPGMETRRFAPPEPSRTIGLVRRATSPAAGWFDALAEVLGPVGDALVRRTRAGGN